MVSLEVGNASYPCDNTVESVLKRHLIGHKNMVSKDRLSLVTDMGALKCGTFCQEEYVVLQDRWSLIAVVSREVWLLV